MSHAVADKSKLLAAGNVAFPVGAGRMVSLSFLAVGVIAIALTALGAFLGDATDRRIALAAYHVGFLATLGMTLGSIFFVMIFHQTNAGWTGTVRRQLENVMSLVPVCLLLFIPVLIFGRFLFTWMDPAVTQGDMVYQAKSAYLNTPFFYARVVVYFTVWLIFSQRLYRLSIGQDTDGDKMRSFAARKMSSYGLPLMAFTSAFAAFDWIMSLDYHWFSTMFGVYFFAGFMGASIALCALTLIILRRAGVLDGLVTNEHLHDLGKLIFVFVVFWAYIGFSQYFLIWYANIPEETMWFQVRRTNGWMPYSTALVYGRFIIPFIILIPRPWRRSRRVLSLIAVWMIVFNIFDMFWMVRPTVTGVEGAAITITWLDVVGALGPVCIFFGLYVRRIMSNRLIPINDPRLDEAISHKNYI